MEPTTENVPEVFELLADRLSTLGMGFPTRPELFEILLANLTEEEAGVLTLFPTRIGPLELTTAAELSAESGRDEADLARALEALTEKGMLYRGEAEASGRGYALLQVGFGFPQTFFWKGEATPHATRMAGLVAKYFGRKVTHEAYSGTPTKPYRYVPVHRSLASARQAVLPFHTMESVLRASRRFAVAHCPCRVATRLKGVPCGHPEEVCLKFDELADFVIERGLAREVTREEATAIVAKSAELGLVHFVDNAEGKVKHNCNCCGCSCWNVGSIRRRKIPRDALMATYFLRGTEEGDCVGCGECAEICPVNAVEMVDGLPVIDREWCIGCGVCATRCGTDAVRLEARDDRPAELPRDFRELHDRILAEKGYR